MTPRFWASRRGQLLGLLLLAALTLFFGSGRVPLLGSDEPRYAEVAREMWQSGDYISPRLAGKLWLEKAPLLYWGQAFFYALLGVGELAARLPSALGALGVVLGLWAAARRALGERAAFYIGVVAATMGMLVSFARAASTDMLLCAAFTGALLSAWNAAHDERRSGWWAAATGAFVGGSMLAKGLVGPLLFVLAAGVWWLGARPCNHSTGKKARKWGAALLFFVAVSAVWYVPIWQQHGPVFWREFIVNQHFRRYTSNQFNHPQPFYFYWIIAPVCALPWTLWIFAALSEAKHLRPRRSARESFLWLAWVWAVVPIAFFSLSGSKLPSYMLPSFPGLAILAGEALSRGRFLPHGWKPKWVALSGAALMVGVVLFAFGIYGPRNETKLSTRALCRRIAAQMRPGERATFFNLNKEYDPVFYLQGRVVPGIGKRDTFVAYRTSELLPFLKSSLLVFVSRADAPLIAASPLFRAQLIGQQRAAGALGKSKKDDKIILVYRLTPR